MKRRRQTLAACLAAGPLALGCPAVLAENPLDKAAEVVSGIFSGGYDVRLIEGTIVNLGQRIVLPDDERTPTDAPRQFSGAAKGLMTEGGDLYLLVHADGFESIVLERHDARANAGESRDLTIRRAGAQTNDEARVTTRTEPVRRVDDGRADVRSQDSRTAGQGVDPTTTDARRKAEGDDAAWAERERKLSEELQAAQSDLKDRYEAKVDDSGTLEVGDPVAVIGKVYSDGGLQAILVKSIHADRDGRVPADRN